MGSSLLGREIDPTVDLDSLLLPSLPLRPERNSIVVSPDCHSRYIDEVDLNLVLVGGPRDHVSLTFLHQD